MKKMLVVCLGVVFMSAAVAMAEVKVNIKGGKQVPFDECMKDTTNCASDCLKIKDDSDVAVQIPFDTEYIIHLANKDQNRRALVNIRIDGRSVTKEGLILRVGETVDLERFLDTGTLNKGNKFKFIPKGESLKCSHKEDGNIIVTVQYEKSSKPLVEYYEDYVSVSSSRLYIDGGSISSTSQSGWSFKAVDSMAAMSNTMTSAQLEPGVTVEGAESTQRFQHDQVKDLEDRIDTLKIKTLGYYKVPPILLNR